MLRAATRAAHDRVDFSFSRFDLNREADYRSFLLAQAAAFLPVEAALDRADAEALLPRWREQRRAPLLRADLDALGLALPPLLAEPRFASPAEVVGSAYVLEGSRLGGAVLARAVRAGLPRNFLSAPRPAGDWRAFLDRLEQLLGSHVEREEAVRGAGKVFEIFARAAHGACVTTEVS